MKKYKSIIPLKKDKALKSFSSKKLIKILGNKDAKSKI